MIKKLIYNVRTGQIDEITLTLNEADRELIDEFSANPDKSIINANGVDSATIIVSYNKNWKLSTWQVNVAVYDSARTLIATDTLTLSDAGNYTAVAQYAFSTEIADTYRFEFELVDLGLKASCEVEAI
ncbi:hypothetical protein [Geoglobus acetivorans]|uniref:Uncharacterized protein n=1 Tax=Geoglobus acetivorans TaxID=565033 RepID=A0A0A7GG32_GEOAI|nr:hypothetical protein GACE_0828 [Geoglobus acetivorans]